MNGPELELIKPMLCKSVTLEQLKNLDSNKYGAELKLDGMRAIVYTLDNEVRVFGRSGIEYTKHLSGEMIDNLFKTLPSDSIFDGELCHISAYRQDAILGLLPVVDFNKTMRVMGSGPAVAREKQKDTIITFVMFDVIQLANESMFNTNYSWRMEELTNIGIYNRNSYLDIVPEWSATDGDLNYTEVFNRVSKLGLEGLVLKRYDSFYLPSKRTNDQLKIKSEKFFDVVVTGYTPGQGKYFGLVGSLNFSAAYTDPNDPSCYKLKPIGSCSGFDDATRIWWTRFFDALEYGHGEVRAIITEPVIEIKCNDLVGSGEYKTPRHPQYVRIRKDKVASECGIGQFKNHNAVES